jgi:tetratricopeptide (TPR) repeat protein
MTPSADRSRWFDAVLAAVVVGFAFLAASFPVRNGDFWMHLAAGRLLAQQQYTFGTDPFAYTTQAVYWANHAWLYDLGLYLGYRSLGGTGLVVLKAAVVALLAALMLRLGRSAEGGGPFWLRAACVLLALLALSPRVLMQPVCMSLLLLAVCLLLLREGGRALVALPAVVALWVNLDVWFLLGPLLVALYWLGERLGSSRTVPLWLLPACLVACLFSPHHVHALTLPPELSPGVWAAFGGEPRFAGLFASPWQLAPLGPAGGYSLSAWAFPVLLVLGGVSFAANRPALRSWRLPVWLAFAALAAWQIRLIPFFAVVAAPITALNFGERLPAHTRPRLGRAVVLLAGLALLALAWPGWLQGFHRRDRAVDWSVRPDPSLHRVATTLSRWRAEGTLPPDARTFAAHPDVGHYCAWFAPGERCFLDSRLPLFLGSAADYRVLCRALDGSSETEGAESLVRPHNIVCGVCYDPDLRRLAPVLRRVAETPDGGRLLHVAGRAVVVRPDGASGGPPPFDPDRAAFTADESPPLDGQGELIGPVPWWEEYLRRPSDPSGEGDAAAVYLRLFEDGAAAQHRRQRVPVLARNTAGLVGLPALTSGGLADLLVFGSRISFEGVFLPDLRERPAALPLLSVRAARRALADGPADADAWLVLAQAYLFLSRTTTEANRNAAIRPLTELRDIQIATALRQAALLRPDVASTHETLALLFAERQFYDLALHHRTRQLELVRRAGRQPGEPASAHADRVERLVRAVEEMRAAVQTSENRYAVRAEPLAGSPLARARIAMELGLAGKALDDVLLRSHPDLYGLDGLRMLLELLLRTGRAAEARELLDRTELREHSDVLGVCEVPGGERRQPYRFHAYDWFDLCQTAAAGRYDGVSAALERMRARMKREEEIVTGRVPARVAERLTVELGLAATPQTYPLRLYAHAERDALAALLAQAESVAVERADLHVLDGMFRLEAGRPVEGRGQFQRALELYRRAPESLPGLPGLPGLPLAERYLERIQGHSRPDGGMP